MITKKFSPYQCSTIQVNKQRNLIYALNVVNVSQGKTPWTDISLFTQEVNRFLANTVIILVHGNNNLLDIYSLTRVNVPSRVVTAIILVHWNNNSSNTYAHTQVKNPSPVMCVKGRSLQAVLWNIINSSIPERSLTNVMCVVGSLHSWVQGTNIRNDVWALEQFNTSNNSVKYIFSL